MYQSRGSSSVRLFERALEPRAKAAKFSFIFFEAQQVRRRQSTISRELIWLPFSLNNRESIEEAYAIMDIMEDSEIAPKFAPFIGMVS